MINTSEIRKRFDTLKAHRNILESELIKNRDLLEKAKERYENSLKARAVIQEVAQATQENIEGMVNEVVTLALRSIPFDENYDFKAEFVQRRNKTECDLWFVTDDGEKIHPLSSTGGGVCDIASLALLFVFKKLSGKRKLIIGDEPLRNLSEDYHDDAAEMVHMLCHKLGIQILAVTHNKALRDIADNMIELK